MTLLKLTNISKNFGSKEVLKNIDLELKEGECLTVLGENGVGKSVLLSLIAGIERPSSGKAELNLGIDKPFASPFGKAVVKELIGIQSDIVGLYPEFTVKEHLDYFSKLKGDLNNQADDLIKYFRLEKVANQISKTLSLGYLRRLNLAIAMCGDIKLLLLDEPSNALDPVEYQFFVEFIEETKTKLNIIMVSHRLDEATVLGGRAIILKDGTIKDDFIIDENLKERYLELHK